MNIAILFTGKTISSQLREISLYEQKKGDVVFDKIIIVLQGTATGTRAKFGLQNRLEFVTASKFVANESARYNLILTGSDPENLGKVLLHLKGIDAEWYPFPSASYYIKRSESFHPENYDPSQMSFEFE